VRRKRGRFNTRLAVFTDWALALTAIAGGVAMTIVLLYSGYRASPKLLGFTVVLYVFGLIWLVRCLVHFGRGRRELLSRRAERRHPGYVDVPIKKIQPPMHRSKRSPRP